jgi:peptidoglycan/xylan/chitin deacetylase (PgdA/CDA1 family)
MDHRRCSDMTSDELRSELRAGRELIEPLSGRPLSGFRAPEWSIRKPSDPALRVLAEEGFQYDASLTSIPPLGAADNPWFPHELQYPDGNVLREFPPLTGRAFFRTLPMGGSWPFRVLSPSRALAARDRMRREAAPAVFTFHPWELDPQHPAMDGLAPLDRLVHFAGRERARQRVEKLLESEQMHALDEL